MNKHFFAPFFHLINPKLKPNQSLLNTALQNNSQPKTKKNQKKAALNGQ